MKGTPVKVNNTLIAWAVTVALGALITALAMTKTTVPGELSLGFTVALGAATGLSLPSAPGTDVIGEVRQLLVEVTSARASSPPAPAPTLPPPAPAVPNVTAANA